MSFQEGQWMFNYTNGDIWYGEYHDTKENAIEAAKSDEHIQFYKSFYIGQIQNAKENIYIYPPREFSKTLQKVSAKMLARLLKNI